MFRDFFDRIVLFGLVACLGVIVLMLGGFTGADSSMHVQGQNMAVERAMQERARTAFLVETFQPVEELMHSGRHVEALMRLQNFEKEFPGEAHTHILRGSILVAQGALHEGIAQYAMAVRLNGDYVDGNSSLSRRDEISRLVAEAIPEIRASIQREKLPAHEKALKQAYYLQSRLAGGCE